MSAARSWSRSDSVATRTPAWDENGELRQTSESAAVRCSGSCAHSLERVDEPNATDCRAGGPVFAVDHCDLI